mgnify:CR=1 FL=1
MAGHQFNWEYLSIFPALVDYDVIISYKILSNPFWEQVIKAMRQRFGGIAVDYRKSYTTMLRFKNENPKLFSINEHIKRNEGAKMNKGQKLKLKNE